MSTRLFRAPFQLVEENSNLIEEHWNEVVRDSRKMDIHWDFFRNVEKNGGLVVFAAEDEQGLVGYGVFVLQWHLHSKYMLTAHNDAIFLRKDKRSGGTGFRLLKYCDSELEKMGVGMIYFHVKPHVDFSPALKKMGYELHENIFVRFTGD